MNRNEISYINYIKYEQHIAERLPLSPTLLDIFSVSISSLCLDNVSFMLHRWSLIILNWSS